MDAPWWRRALINRSKEILFEVTEDALLIANGGRAFSRTGVLSICASHFSDKLSGLLKDLDCADSELVQAIRDIRLQIYEISPNDITSDFRSQDETKKDYGGRFVWELLQNADDAMREESGDFIGSKGLGFKSVLEITDDPEIHSGLFHFRFSAEETQTLLREKDLHDDPPPLAFRIPHEREPDSKIRKLLDAGYATVVRLPFRDEQTRNRVVVRLNSLEPLFLLLAHEMSCIRVRVPEGETVYEIRRSEPGLSTGVVELSSRGLSTSWRRWVRSEPLSTDNNKRLTVAVCLPMRSGGVNPHDTEIPFHVFFPTEEKIGAHALVHASFELEQNRKHVRPSENDVDILGVFSKLFQEVLKEVPARTALEAFGRIVSEDEDSLLGRLQKGIRDTLCETLFVPVIGGERVKPGKAGLWNDRLGFVLRDDAQEVRDARLLTPELRDLGRTLKVFGARYIEDEDYIRLLHHCRNESLEECLASWRAWAGGGLKRLSNQWGEDREKSLEWLRKIPCWWTETETARALDDTSRLLRDRPDHWPDWLPADSLHPVMLKMLRRFEARLKNDSDWKERISGWLLQNEAQFLHDALLPFIAKWDDECWEADGWRALCQVLSWSPRRQFEGVPPWVEVADGNQEEKRRAETTRTLLLPTDKGWLPAADCYAGEAWGGPPAFDRFFANVKDRGLVLPFQEWPDSIQKETCMEQWKSLLRWAGVSWEPKVRRAKSPPSSHDLGLDYIKDLSRQVRDWIRNWKIEYFPECMEDDNAKPADIISIMLHLAEAVRKPKAAYWALHARTNDTSCRSFADFQLCHEKWLPCKRALLHNGKRAAPREAFLPGKGLGGLLPEVDRGGIENEEWYQRIQGGLTGMGIQEELPTDPTGLEVWMRKLSELSAGNDTKEDIRKAADALYRGYLKLDGGTNEFPQDITVPCLSWENEQETLTFSLPGDVSHVDQPHLDEVKRKIMQEGYKLFILSPGSGGNASERLGVRSLSGTLQAEPHYETEDGEESNKLLERYRERRRGLELAAKLAKPLPEDMALIAVRELRLKLTDGERHVADVEVLSWRQMKDDPLLINLDKDEWRALGHGLAERVGGKADKASLFENLLRETDKEVYLDRLRQEGVTEDDIEHAESAWSLIQEGEQVSGQYLASGDQAESSLEPQVQEEGGQISEPRTQDSSLLGDRDGSHSQQQDGRRPTERSSQEPLGEEHVRKQGGGGRPHSSGTEGGTQRPRPETGRMAEDWFEQRLENTFPGHVERRVRDTENRESDFVVIMNDGDKLHIEVKHAANRPGTFYWSGGEYEKASDLEGGSDKYVIAILFPDGEEGYEIRWIWRPLDELQGVSCEVQWIGNSDYERVDLASWDDSEKRPDEVPAKRYVFRIRLDGEILESFDKDDGSLDKLRKKINGMQCSRPDSNRHGVAPTSPSY